MTELKWWQRSVIYQIYPRSFLDTAGDGVGDLKGILTRLDYLTWLGVDAFWMSPIFPSPMADFGYDVADYTAIHPSFGTMDDFDRLIAEAHGRDLKVILDFVPNHTSDQHPWFRESRSSRTNARRNWYIWRDPTADGGPPNNWLSDFGGSAWELDRATGQYYYHAFLKEQPDLNWRNPQVRAAMYDVLRFWMARGVDGFRVDVLWHLIKDDQFRDNPPNPAYQPDDPPANRLLQVYTTDRPEVHDVVAELRAVVSEYPERMMIGEIYLPLERLVAYYGQDRSGAHLPFNFALLQTPWTAEAIATLIEEYESLLPEHGWPNWVLSNHDKGRVVSRVGSAQARIAAILLLTLRGTPTMYYGDEIGMEDVPIPPRFVRDPYEKNVPGLGVGRDPARTPMQWDPSANAGFTTGSPWLPVAADHAQVNVAVERDDPTSLLSLYRRLIALRRREAALIMGAYHRILAADGVLAYERKLGDCSLLVALNMESEPRVLAFEHPLKGRVELSSHMDRDGEAVSDDLALRGAEGLILSLE